MRTPSSRVAGRTALVTGGSSGIGREVVRQLAWRGVRVFTASRPAGRGEAVAAALRRETGNPDVTFLPVDLLSLASVRRLAAEVTGRMDRLDLLLNHAGAYFGRRTSSEDGYEATFASHHLAHFLLTVELRGVLAAAGATDAPARVVTTSSRAARYGSMDRDDPMFERGYSGWQAYARANLANQLFAIELAERWRERPVVSHVYHPGFVDTAIGPDPGAAAFAWRALQRLFGRSVREGSVTALHLLCHPDPVTLSGRYWEDVAPAHPAKPARDAGLRAWLWERSLAWTGASDA